MNTHAAPEPIPILMGAQAQRPVGFYDNTPYPLGLLQMPMQAISWLLYRAATCQTIVEWTPLAEGPGTRVDYSGDPNWDGTRFLVFGPEREIPNPQGISTYGVSWGLQYATPQIARDEVRGYNVFTTEDPNDPDWSWAKKPGQWINSGRFVPLDSPEITTEGTMRYDVPANWPAMASAFTTSIATNLAGWLLRLQNWLAAEQAKVPPNINLIQDIQRQILVANALSTQITTAANSVLAEIETGDNDQGKTNSALLAMDSFARWVAAEEILEAFSVTTMPLNVFRRDIVGWIKFLLSKPWYGWEHVFSSQFTDVQFLGAGLSSAAFNSLTTNAIPALSTGQIAVNLSRPLELPNLSPPYGYNPGFSTIFSTPETVLESEPEPVLVPAQIIALGPVALGFTSEACLPQAGAVLPNYGDGVESSPLTTQTFPLLSGVEVGTFRIEDGVAIGTQPVPGIKIYECPLFANADRVGALNITWRVLSLRP